MKRKISLLLAMFLVALGIVACGNAGARENGLFGDRGGAGENTVAEADANVTKEVGATDNIGQNDATNQMDSSAVTTDTSKEEPEPEQFLPGYATFDEWRDRHLGSVGLIKDKTLLVSIYLEEPDFKWEQSDIDYTREMMRIGYGYIADEMKKYNVTTELIFDSKTNADLCYQLPIDENIPVYVTTEQERELDDKVDLWLENIPIEDLMKKYEADSIGFLFFIAHEGCSYSSMHFIDDGIKTWDECCMLYLRDMYSKTLEYETPAVYAHELLHLFGAEDLYKSAEVFEPETYAYVNKTYPHDVMIDTYEMIGGKYVIYPDKVVQEISPITAYLVGATDDESVVSECPELIKEEAGCFSGSTYDRPF